MFPEDLLEVPDNQGFFADLLGLVRIRPLSAWVRSKRAAWRWRCGARGLLGPCGQAWLARLPPCRCTVLDRYTAVAGEAADLPAEFASPILSQMQAAATAARQRILGGWDRMPLPAMIDLEQVSKDYGGQRVVDRVSLRVEAGELLVLLGSSGSGKTTTCKMINRLIEPSSGTIRIAGQDVRDLDGHVLRRRIGYAFQRLGLFPHLTVAENIGITPRLLGWEAARIQARVHALLELVELDPARMRDRLPSELSGARPSGWRSRVPWPLSRRCCCSTSRLALSIPDARARLQVSFDRIRRSLGLTAVFVTHDVTEAMLLADRVAVLRDGRLLLVGNLPRARQPGRRSLCARAGLGPAPTSSPGAVATGRSRRMSEPLRHLPTYLIAHLALSLSALLLGCCAAYRSASW